MPELPEVETVRRGLSNLILGRRVSKVKIFETRLRHPVDADEIGRALLRRRIEAIERRAKYLLFRLDSDTVLLAHLGMTGRFHVSARSAPLELHNHASFELDDGRELRFIDPRRFGLLKLVPASGIARDALLSDLGPEPLSEAFDAQVLIERARGSKRPVKSMIMDAKVVVGVGNIYASESLWRAGIHPHRAAGRISAARWERLTTEIKAVLEEAIAQGGTTLKDFAGPEGAAGYFRIDLAVYDRETLPCRRCGSAIRRSVQSNRSTYYCSSCQR